jgi:signal transduction histidine kinase
VKVHNHRFYNRWARGFVRSLQGVLAKKLLLSILLFSFFVTLLVSAFILYSDYQDQLSAQDRNLEQLETGYVSSVSYSLWNFSTEQLQAQLEGIMSFPNVIYAGVKSNNLDQKVGSPKSSNIIREVQYDLTFMNDGELLKIGTLNIVIDQKYIYVSLIKKGLTIVITQLFKTLTVSLFILFLINTIVTQHLIKMARWAKGLDIYQPLLLERPEYINDEISDVTQAINTLRVKHITSLERVKRVQEELEVANEELEVRVAKRTQDLVDAIDNLKTTQSKLVESEKLASLGKLIAGVAHELNTPLGVCMTAQSYLNEVVQDIDNKIKVDKLTRSDFDNSVKVIVDAVSLLDANLSRSRSLISNFKKLALNSSDQVISRFSLTQLIRQIEEELSLMLAEQHIKLKLLYVNDIEVETFLEPLKNVIEQLIRNSLEHGFKDSSGSIYICVIKGDDCLYIDYRDDGVGIVKELQKSMFDPFVTTERLKGQVGLGLHIVYNFITQILGGTITYLDSNMGTHFSIEIPMDINKKDQRIKSIQPDPIASDYAPLSKSEGENDEKEDDTKDS